MMLLRLLVILLLLTNVAEAGTYQVNGLANIKAANELVNPATANGCSLFVAPSWSYNSGTWTPAPIPGATLWDAAASVFTSGTYAWTRASLNTIANVGNALQITYVDSANGAQCYLQDSADLSANLTPGTWYQFQVDFKINSGSAKLRLLDSTSSTNTYSPTLSNTDFATQTMCVLAHSIDHRILLSAFGTGQVATLDNLSLKPLTLAQMLAVRNYGAQKAVAASLTMTSGLPGGVVTRYSNSSNFISCYHDGVNLRLETVIGGTWTTKINTASTYVAGATIEIRWADANTAQAWYNGAQVGTNQDVSAVPAGNWAGVFGTNDTVSLAAFTAS